MLFTMEKDEKPSARERMAFCDDGGSQSFSLQSMNELRNNLGNLEVGKHYHFWSRGQWSMHELLDFLLIEVGQSDVFLTTWTITEDPMRKLFLLKQDGIIKKLHCILDHRIKGRKPKPFQLLENTADRLKLTECHAKSLVIINDRMPIAVIGSANLSRNPRLEAGVITTVSEVVNFHLNIIQNEFNR